MLARGVDFGRFRDVYFSEAFNLEIMRAVKLQERSLQTRTTDLHGRETFRFRIVPHVALPGFIDKLLQGNRISYDEITVLDPVARTATFAVETPAGDIVRVRGDVSFVEGPEGVRFCFDGEAKIAVFGLGGALERFLVHEVKQRYALVEHALQRFLERGEG